LLAGSISLVGFGVDSFIEVTTGATLLWRMSVDADVERRERNEKLSLRIVGICFIALATYISYEAISDLTQENSTSAHSIPGLVLACVSLVVMPILSRAKKKVGKVLHSAARRDEIWLPLRSQARVICLSRRTSRAFESGRSPHILSRPESRCCSSSANYSQAFGYDVCGHADFEMRCVARL
jgi:hypothetical protein